LRPLRVRAQAADDSFEVNEAADEPQRILSMPAGGAAPMTISPHLARKRM
jgi:hypothetical protein